jgi:hypothetical protein
LSSQFKVPQLGGAGNVLSPRRGSPEQGEHQHETENPNSASISAATLIEHWNGTSWSIVSGPNPHPNTSSGAGEMAAVSADDIFCLALGVIEQWNGSSWTIVDTLSGFGATGITALSDGTVVVVGENGAILHN